MDSEQLRLMSSAEGYERFYDYCRKVSICSILNSLNIQAKRHYFDVLSDFPTAKPPLEYFIDLMRPIKARPFSISSSFKVSSHD